MTGALLLLAAFFSTLGCPASVFAVDRVLVRSGTRMQLLERLETLLPNIDATTLNNQVFQHITTGFMDTEPLLREATVKSALHLAPALNGMNSLALLKCVLSPALHSCCGSVRVQPADNVPCVCIFPQVPAEDSA